MEKNMDIVDVMAALRQCMQNINAVYMTYGGEHNEELKELLKSIGNQLGDVIEQGNKWFNGVPYKDKPSLETFDSLFKTPESSSSTDDKMPEPADGETVTKTTVSKSKGGVGDALRKAVEGVGGLSEDEGEEEESGDENNMDMSDEGAGNLLKVLQNKF